MEETTIHQLEAEIKRLEAKIEELEKAKKKCEEDLSLDSYLLNVLMDNIPDAIYFKDRTSRFIRISTALARRFGFSGSSEAAGKSDFDFFSIEHAQQAFNDEQDLIKTGKELVDIEEKETWADKPGTWVSTTKMCLKNADGEIIGTFGISRDITERKNAEDALKASEAKYKELYDNAPVGYHEIDLEGNIIRVNVTEARMLGYRPDEIIGRNIMEFLPCKFKNIAKKEMLGNIASNGTPHSAEWKYLCKDGREIDVILTYRPGYNDDGKPVGAFITIQDITEKKKASRKLKRTTISLKNTTRKLKRSNAELEHFAYIASHDLQEPLRMVSGFLQLLSRRYKNKLDSDADDFINFAVDGAGRMQALINDLLVYSRVDTKGRPFAPTDLNYVLDIVRINLKVAIEESGAIIRSGTLPVIPADQGQMLQLFQNLICNAIKFRTDKIPEIDIACSQEEGKWVFSVADNGIGIDPVYSDRIFMLFQRLHTKQDYPGTGIGLSVCKKIVERHEGEIWVKPRPEGGSAFYFTIPYREPKEKADECMEA